jgi:hypothetical protein
MNDNYIQENIYRNVDYVYAGINITYIQYHFNPSEVHTPIWLVKNVLQL